MGYEPYFVASTQANTIILWLRVDTHDQRICVFSEVFHTRREETRLPAVTQQQLRPLSASHIEATSIAEVHQGGVWWQHVSCVSAAEKHPKTCVQGSRRTGWRSGLIPSFGVAAECMSTYEFATAARATWATSFWGSMHQHVKVPSLILPDETSQAQTQRG